MPPETLASETVWSESCQPDVSRGNVVPTDGRLVVKFGLAPFSVTGVAPPKVGAPGAVIQTLPPQDGGGLLNDRTLEGLLEELLPDEPLPEELLPEELLPDELVLDVVLFEVVLFAVVLRELLPSPPEQAATATRQIDNARRKAPFRTGSMKFPQIIIVVQGHGN